MICLKRDILLLLKLCKSSVQKTPSQVPGKNRVISVDLAAGGGGGEERERRPPSLLLSIILAVAGVLTSSWPARTVKLGARMSPDKILLLGGNINHHQPSSSSSSQTEEF